MQRLEVSGAVRLIYRSLGVKRLKSMNRLKIYRACCWMHSKECAAEAVRAALCLEVVLRNRPGGTEKITKDLLKKSILGPRFKPRTFPLEYQLTELLLSVGT